MESGFFLLIFAAMAAAGTIPYLLGKRKEAALQRENALLKEEERAAHTAATEAKTRLVQLTEQHGLALEERAIATEKRLEAEKKAEVAAQRLRDMEERLKDWEKTKEESMQAAREAMFKTGTETFRRETENILTQTRTHFEGVVHSVAALSDRLARNESLTGTLWKSLATPTEAGAFSEIGLENTLRAYGLEAGRDYVTQYAVKGASGNNLRPDAVVFLTGGNILVIDSKATSFFVELGNAHSEEQRAEVLGRIKKTMQEHFKSLTGKGYRDAVRDYISAGGRENLGTGHIFMLMFIQTESYVEALKQADPGFFHRAEVQDILIAGPAGLAGVLSAARFEITRAQQQDNQQEILKDMSRLMDALEMALAHAGRIGRSIEMAARHFSGFAASVNRYLLPRAHRLQKMGVTLSRNKTLPPPLPSYQVMSDNAPLLEGEAEEEEKQLEMAEE